MKEIDLLEHFEEIERYLDGLMDEQERLDFEKRLAMDTGLSAAFSRHKQIYQALGDEEMIEFRKKLTKVVREEEKKSLGDSRMPRLNGWLWIAATLVLLAGLTFLANRLITERKVLKSEKIAHIHDEKQLDDEIFQLPAYYFDLKNMVVRGGEFQLLHPPDSLVLTRDMKVHFNFSTCHDTPLTFIVTDREGNTLKNMVVGRDNYFKIRLNWDPGIYVYQFRREEELVYLGVFFISE